MIFWLFFSVWHPEGNQNVVKGCISSKGLGQYHRIWFGVSTVERDGYVNQTLQRDAGV